MMYVQDYDETVIPYSATGSSGTNANPTNFAFPWTLLVQPYSKNFQVLKCPDSPFAIGYTYNANLARADGYGNTFPSGPRSLAGIALPAVSPIFIDGTSISGPAANPNPQGLAWPYPYNQALAFFITNTPTASGRIIVNLNDFTQGWAASNPSAAQGTGESLPGSVAATRHSQGANYAFADGHVKFIRAPDVTKVNNPALAGLNYEGDGQTGPARTATRCKPLPFLCSLPSGRRGPRGPRLLAFYYFRCHAPLWYNGTGFRRSDRTSWSAASELPRLFCVCVPLCASCDAGRGREKSRNL